MSRQGKQTLILILIGLCVIVGIFVLAQQQKMGIRVLRLPHTMPTDHPVHQGLLLLADRVKSLSDGKMVIQIYPSAMLGGESQIKELMQHGVVDIGKFSTSAFEDNIPEMAAFSLPYLFRNAEHYWTVLESPLGHKILDAGYETAAKLKGLCYYDAGARSFYSRKKAGAMATPSQLKGKKIRVMSTAFMTEAVEAMGGTPTPIPFGELFTALQTGIIDAAENNIPSYWTNKHYEECPILTLSEHFRTPDILVMNRSVWDALSPEERAIFKTAAGESAAYERKLWEDETQRELKQLRGMGIEIVPADQKALAEAAQKFYRSLEAQRASSPRIARVLETAAAIRAIHDSSREIL